MLIWIRKLFFIGWWVLISIFVVCGLIIWFIICICWLVKFFSWVVVCFFWLGNFLCVVLCVKWVFLFIVCLWIWWWLMRNIVIFVRRSGIFWAVLFWWKLVCMWWYKIVCWKMVNWMFIGLCVLIICRLGWILMKSVCWVGVICVILLLFLICIW